MGMSTPPPARSGRRPGPSVTRDAIAAAAREQFATLGFDRTTIRGVASAAGVDPALVVHYFGSKERLFRDVMALPAAITDAVSALAEAPKDEIGTRLATLVVAALENPMSRTIVLGRIRGAVSQEIAASLVRDLIAVDIRRLVDALGVDEAETRAALVGSQIVGLGFARHVVSLEPLASMPPDALIAAIAPTLQRYLTGSIS
jgi:AcrR family transcriptional regulator